MNDKTEIKWVNANTRKLAKHIKVQRTLDIKQQGIVKWGYVKKSKTTLIVWLK